MSVPLPRVAAALLLATALPLLFAGCPKAGPATGAAPAGALLDPSLANEQAPEEYTVRFQTTEGVVVIDVVRSWAPLAADRFYNLVRIGYYDDVAFFRTIAGFMTQFGINGDPAVNAVWREATFPDDPVTHSNTRGMVTFATAGPGTRTTQVFINYKDNSRLDAMGFAPFGVVRDMKVVDKFWVGYGEGDPMGPGPNQVKVQEEGNAYLRAGFPKLTWLKRATIVR